MTLPPSLIDRLWWLGLVLLLILTGLALALGSHAIPLKSVLTALQPTPCAADQLDCLIIQQSRLPRALAGIMAGIAFGLSATLIQLLTRNPLADTGVLGINAGASLATVLCISLSGPTVAAVLLLAAFGGALATCLLLIMIGMLAQRGALSPLRLTLAGMAVGAALEGVASGLALLDPTTFDHMRFWRSGSLDIHGYRGVALMFVPLIAGMTMTFAMRRGLAALTLGRSVAHALGGHPPRLLIVGVIAIALLSGSAIATVGPVAFLGLISAHLARFLAQGRLGWQLRWVVLIAPLLLLSADLAARLLFVSEIRVSILTAALGGPLLVLLARRLAHKGA